MSLVLVMAFMVGCQSLSFDPRGHQVPESSWIRLPPSGEYFGVWNNEDLTLDYKFVRDQKQLSVGGAVRFADRITKNFSMIDYFHLDAIPVDAQGKVLAMIGLTSAARVSTQFGLPLDFNSVITLPANTAAIAFSYRGRAYSGGSGEDNDLMDFWEYPVY